MNLLQKLALVVSLMISSIVFSQDKTIKITAKRNSDKSVEFLYEKTKPGSYTVKINFNKLENTNSSNITRVITNSRGSLGRLRPSDPKKHVNFSYGYSYFSGKLNPKVDINFTYLLPVETNEAFEIKETGSASEKYLDKQKPNSWKAYVIARKNKKVFAMRKGIVVDIKNDYSIKNESDFKYTSQKNSLTIEHEDGTYATYKGFEKDSYMVKLGQTVFPYTELGSLHKNEANDAYRLYFYINYRFKDGEDIGTEFLAPNFLTSDGILVLEKNKTYTASYNEEVFFQEFSKKEKKKYLKAKGAL